MVLAGRVVVVAEAVVVEAELGVLFLALVEQRNIRRAQTDFGPMYVKTTQLA